MPRTHTLIAPAALACAATLISAVALLAAAILIAPATPAAASGEVGPARVSAGPVRVVSSSASRLIVDLDLSDARLRPIDVDGLSCVAITAPGLTAVGPAGHPEVPIAARLVAVPPTARVSLRVLDEATETLEGVTLAPVPDTAGVRTIDAHAYGAPGWQALASTEDLGILRGIRAHALRIHPVRYDGPGRRLRLTRHLRLEVRFEGTALPSPRAAATGRTGASQEPGNPLYGAFLNAPPAAWRRPAPAARPLATSAEWYDPSRSWVKVLVEDDGVYRLTPDWLDDLGVATGAIDPVTLRLLHLGEEQFLRVTGGDDGRFDGGDEVLFYGRYRRNEGESGPNRDFDSVYGRTETYWLTWGGEAGRRFAPRPAAPLNGYPESPWYWTTTHIERDCTYQQFEYAENDAEGDHWFWQCGEASRFPYPDRPGAATFAGELTAPWLEEEYQARLRVALHGHSVLGQHHNFIKLNGKAVAERIWEGQESLIIDEGVPSSYLRNGINRVVLQGLADLTPVELIWFNWFAIDHRRHYYAWPGFLAWEGSAAPDGRRITLFGMPTEEIELFDVANGTRLTGLSIGTTDSTFTATFEDRPDAPPHYVAVDRSQLRTPTGEVDTPSSWRSPDNGADYVVLTHPLFEEAAEELAAHRRSRGLEVAVVHTDDVYDEFAHGRFTSDAIGDFISWAYHNWQTQPSYVMLLGDGTWDYRNIYGSYVPSFVPTRYYHARGRGISPSDYHYGLVDGGDLLADLAIGRLGVETAEEARGAVRKVIDYDLAPADGDWRNRVVYTANYHAKSIFSAPSDSLAARYTEPLGLRSVRVYDTDEDFLPKPIGRDFIEALSAGSLVFGFAGHGAAGGMWPFFTIQGAVVGSGIDSQVVPEWDYLSQVENGRRLPLVVALSCLNGMFVHPHDWADALAEVFTTMADGGAIAYISATAEGRVSENDRLADALFQQFFARGALAFGPALNVAKAQVLAANSSFVTVVETMQLFGDPAQELALAPTPDYEAVSLAVEPTEPTVLSVAQVQAVVRNNTRLGPDSIAVALVAVDESGHADTLSYRRRPAFTGTDTSYISWLVGPQGGARSLALTVDDAGAVLEENEGDNRLELAVEVLEAATALPVFPVDGGQLRAGDLVLVAAAPLNEVLSGDHYTCEFVVGTDLEFAAPELIAGAVPAEDGRCAFRPESPATAAAVTEAAAGDPLYWRVRVLDGAVPGPWSAARSLRLLAASSPEPASDHIRWINGGEQLLLGEAVDVAVAAGALGVTPAVRPFRPGSSTREDGFTVRDLDGAGVVCTDGAYLYVKRWYNDASTVYPGTDFFTRVGTGFGGTDRSRNYGAFGDSTTAGISATFHGDGYIYNESGRAFELERFDPRTGRLDTISVPDGLLEWKYGRVEGGHSLITSDGDLVYNVSMSTPRGTRTEWGARVFDPAEGWRLVREFTSPPTETAFTFEWTDGILADGQHLYFLEYGGQRRVRMVSAADGALLDEWIGDQDTTRVISGQFDWINNKVWLGDLLGSGLFRYRGVGRPTGGRVASPAIGPAVAWDRARVSAEAGPGILSVALQTSHGDSVWRDVPGMGDLTPGQTVDLAGLPAADHPYLRFHAALRDSTATVRLRSWQVDYQPRPSLELAGATAAILSNDGGPGEDAPARVALSVAVRNRSPRPQADVTLGLELDDGAVLSSHRLDTLSIGAVRVVADTVPLPPPGRRLIAAVATAAADADPKDNRLIIPLLFDGRAPLGVRLWPADRAFLDGDPLRRGEHLLVTAPPVLEPRLVLALDGEPVPADSLLPEAAGYGLRALLRLDLSPGRHQLQARLFSGLNEIGLHTVEIRAVDELTVSNALVHPHPVRGEADFTFVLSEPAEVTVDIYALTGRQVRRLGPESMAVGFGQLPWDGRNRDGDPVASGTYLYLLRARAANGREAIRREPFVVMR